jgi:hypothetical protein
LLASLVERRAGGQKRLPLGSGGPAAESRALVAASVMEQAEAQENADTVMEGATEESAAGQPERPEPTHAAGSQERGLLLPGKGSTRKPAHYGLDIQFEDRLEDLELGHLVESTVWVNRAHPAYRRALASRSIGYHIALAVAMALAPLAVESANEHGFVTAFLSRWGEALGHHRRRGEP